jgi:hypothetical protein
MKPENFSYSFSYTQPYSNWDMYRLNMQKIDIENEIARLDFLEEQIQSMKTYPDAEKIIHQIMGRQSDR